MNRYMLAALAAMAIYGFDPCSALAGEALLLEEIVIQGEKLSPREENLTIREVRESSARDIGEALRQVEGVTYVRKGAIANDVVLRGFQRDNINVLVDGVRLHGACPNRMDPPAFHFDFAEVEQIRVIKGPYDLQNPGSLGGLVEVVTRSAGKGFGSDLNLTYGSYDTTNASATLSYGGERFDGLAGYAFRYSDVPEAGDGKLITDIYPGTSPNRYRPEARDSKAYEIHSGWAKIGYAPTAKSRTELSYSHQDADHVLYPYLKMDADYDRTDRLNWSFAAKELAGLLEEVELQAYWNQVDHLMDDSLRQSSVGKPRDYSMETDASTKVLGAKAQVAATAGGGSLRSGVDFYQRNWDALNRRAMFTMVQPYQAVNMIPDVETRNLGLFIGYERPLADRFVLQGGARADAARIEAQAENQATAIDDSTEFTEISGNLQLTFTPASGLEIFTGLARGVRIPDPEELYINVPAMAPAVTWRGNPDLDPTVNHQVDLGVKYSTHPIYLDAAVFYSDLHDFIYLSAPSDTLKSYRNIDATLWGAELGVQVVLPLDLYLKLSGSYTEGRNEDEDAPLAEIPPLRGSASLRYDVERWFVEVVENLAARQDRVDETLNEEETAGWATTDLKAGVNYRNLSVFAGVNNLFDKHYVTHLSYLRDPFAAGVRVPETGRNYYLTVACRF